MAGEQSAYTATGNPVLITDTYMSDIANAIRAKTGSVDTYTPAQMASAISAIETGGSNTFNALLPSQQGNYRSLVRVPTNNVLSLSGIGTLSNILQIRYIVFTNSSIKRTYIYTREAWINYGAQDEYADWVCVPLIHLMPDKYNGLTTIGLASTYLYPDEYAKEPFLCLDKNIFLNNDLSNIRLYQISGKGKTLGSVSSNMGPCFIMWDIIENMPTE